MEINLCVGVCVCVRTKCVLRLSCWGGRRSWRKKQQSWTVGRESYSPTGQQVSQPTVVGFVVVSPQSRQSFPRFLLRAGRKNNWPPLPEKFPVGPCFYHDISVDIPVEFQKTVKIMYNLWMCKQMWPHAQRGEERLCLYCFTLSPVVSSVHAGTLFVNMFGCLAWFCVDSSHGVDFGLAMLWFLLFTPCSFVCWYRPLYGAFRWAAIHKDHLESYFLASVPVSPPSSLSPVQERQFFPLLRLLLCLYLSVWRSRPANNRHQRLGNLVTVFMLLLTALLPARARPAARLTLSPVVCLAQWLDRVPDWSEHQYPGGHHHVAHRCSLHRSVCVLAHYV